MFNRDPKEFSGLSTRAFNVLNNLGMLSKSQTRKAIKSKVLKPGKVRNYGRETEKEICRWAGIEVPKRNPLCPHCGKEIIIKTIVACYVQS